MAPFEEIKTPNKVQALQRTLYRKAKSDRCWRAWSLYGDLCRRDVLATAFEAVSQKAGAPGIDGVTTEAVQAAPEAFLAALHSALRDRSYRPGPVLRVWIPKGDGQKRPLGIPTVKDRVVQMALLILLQPIFEADFDEGSFGYRPGRHAHQALAAITTAVRQGRYEVIDADLSGYFDAIPHAALLRLVARRVSDGSILRLVKLFLKAPIVEEKDGRKTSRGNDRGTPQGGVISPLLANVYLDSLDHGVNDNPGLDAKLVRYADDFVLLCRPGAAAALYARLKVYLQRKGLRLNEAKSRCVDVRQASFQFLGFNVSWRQSRRGCGYPHVEPSAKARLRLRNAVRAELNHWSTWRSSLEAVRRVNAVVRGWSQYFHYANSTRVFTREQSWVRERYRRWLWRKYGRKRAHYLFFTAERLHGLYGLWPMPQHAPWTR